MSGQACGKRRFKTRARALGALQGIRARSDRDRIPVRAYPCPRCHGWHLTSDPA